MRVCSVPRTTTFCSKPVNFSSNRCGVCSLVEIMKAPAPVEKDRAQDDEMDEDEGTDDDADDRDRD